ncbi:MAG: hypothetical protein ACO1RA_10265 [Planctomycetaceae bacterium]
MSIENKTKEGSSPSAMMAVLLGAMAGGLGWGIRGQYGHETGAMLAGLLVSLTLTLLFCKEANLLAVTRAVAWCTVGIGFGGSMTYGQTIGLTQNAPVIGNWHALGLGMLGLAIKGGLWIGFGGAFLGIGLGGVRYRSGEMLLLMLGLIGLSAVGVWLFNEPFDVSQRILPKIYFSANWDWEPSVTLKPRREVWGGFLLALIGLLLYASVIKRDGLALRMGLWGILGGMIGFPMGQSLQAFHAWNLEWFRSPSLAAIDPLINWWNWMETTFGLVLGGTLGLGLWTCRSRIKLASQSPTVSLSFPGELLLLAVHLILLSQEEFEAITPIAPQLIKPALRILGDMYDQGLILGLIPIVAIAGGRYWPAWLILPVTMLPYAGKTVRELVYKGPQIEELGGWAIYFAVPMCITVALAWWISRPGQDSRPASRFLQVTLLATTWLYWSLNFAFFHFPWPWETWTMRTANGLMFTACAIAISLYALTSNKRP